MRSKIEMFVVALGTALCLLTLAWPEWIEAVSPFEPDGGDGGAEAGFAVAFAAVAVLAAVRPLWRFATR